jgi:hypothetical protein
MKNIFILFAFFAFCSLIPDILFAQAQNNFAKKSIVSAPQDKQTASKDSSMVQKDSSHVFKGVMFQAVKSNADTSKNKHRNEQFQKKMPAQAPIEEKQTIAPPK